MHRHLDRTPAHNRASWGAHYLRAGFMLDGWELYEARLETEGDRSQFLPTDAPRWDGAVDLASKRILLWHEQGFGDMILMLRFVPRLAQMGAIVVLALPDALCRLAASLTGATEIIGVGDAYEDVDYQASLLSLPHLLRVRLATVPARTPYLSPPDSTRAFWRQRLGPRVRPRIGLTCSGRASDSRDARRSIPLAEFAPLLATPGADFHLLQNHIRPTDLPALAELPMLRPHCDALTDFAEVAGLAMEMDLIVSVCTVGAHLAGALGRSTWVALSTGAYCLWMEERADSPWYPSARLFRQSEPNDWRPVIARMAAELPRSIGTRA